MCIELRVIAASYEVAMLPPRHWVPGLFPGFISHPHLVLMLKNEYTCTSASALGLLGLFLV